MADIDNEHHVFSACNKIRYISLFFFLPTTDWNHILFALYSKIDISSLELKQDCKMYSEWVDFPKTPFWNKPQKQ